MEEDFLRLVLEYLLWYFEKGGRDGFGVIKLKGEDCCWCVDVGGGGGEFGVIVVCCLSFWCGELYLLFWLLLVDDFCKVWVFGMVVVCWVGRIGWIVWLDLGGCGEDEIGLLLFSMMS